MRSPTFPPTSALGCKNDDSEIISELETLDPTPDPARGRTIRGIGHRLQ